MKKTISVNIKGTNFIIEEDAFETLQSYLNRLEKCLKNEIGSREIIDDIEYRIAELCSEFLIGSKQVIELEDIQKIIDKLGQPEQYIDDSFENHTDSNNEKLDSSDENIKTSKRLYRDEENGKIAGVCSGLAQYIGIDVIIIRAAFLLFFFVGGSSLFLYFILWFITPKATSSLDRLRMQGKPITLDNVKDEIETVVKKVENESKSFVKKVKNNPEIIEKINGIGAFIRTALGSFILFIGFIGFVGVMTFGVFDYRFIPAKTDFGFLSFSDLGSLFVEESDDLFWLKILAILVGFSIITNLFISGLKLIFKVKHRLLKFIQGGLHIVSIVLSIICIVIFIKIGREYTIGGKIERTIGSINTELLEVKTVQSAASFSKDYRIKSTGFDGFVSIHNNQIEQDDIDFVFRNSADTSYHVYLELSARAYTHSKAIKKAKNIRYPLKVSGNQILIGSTFSFPKRDKIRDQNVKIIIEIPKGKVVKMPHQTVSPEFSIDNNNNSSFEIEGEMDINGEFEMY